MFAYCGNNPVCFSDPNGENSLSITDPRMAHLQIEDGCGASGLVPIIVGGIWITLESLAGYLKREVYYAAHLIKVSMQDSPDDELPVVHHIVPHGSFSGRSLEVQRRLAQAQSVLISVDIDPENDPLNLMIVSTAYHRHLHTDDYLMYVSNAVNHAGSDRTAVINTLFALRIIIWLDDPIIY